MSPLGRRVLTCPWDRATAISISDGDPDPWQFVLGAFGCPGARVSGAVSPSATVGGSWRLITLCSTTWAATSTWMSRTVLVLRFRFPSKRLGWCSAWMGTVSSPSTLSRWFGLREPSVRASCFVTAMTPTAMPWKRCFVRPLIRYPIPVPRVATNPRPQRHRMLCAHHPKSADSPTA